MKIFIFLSYLIERLCIVVGAFIGSQFPSFMQQYTQRLAGHAEAIKALVDQLRAIASFSHKTLAEYIHKFQASGDSDFAEQAEFMQRMISRSEELKSAAGHLTEGSVWLRPYYFFADFQSEVAASTYASFEPGLTLTIEGLCYAGLGMVAGWLFYRSLSLFIRLIFKKFVR